MSECVIKQLNATSNLDGGALLKTNFISNLSPDFKTEMQSLHVCVCVCVLVARESL